MVLLLGGVLGVARTYLERPRHYAPFVVIAVAISIYAGARTVPMFTRLDRDSDQRLAELEALAPGKTYTANGWEQVNEGWFFLGDDFRDQKKRELVARYFALRRVLFRGGELWGTLGVSDAKLVMRYELEPAVCIDQLETIDVKQYLGRDVATLHRTFLEQVDEIRFATPARIKFIDVLVGFSGERPPLPRQTVYLARWRDGVLEGYTASMHRRGRSTTRVLTLSDQLLGEVHLRRALLHVGPVEALHIRLLEHGGHRLDRLELLLDRIEVLRLEHAGALRSLVRVLGEDVPAAEDDVVELRERDVLADRRRPFVGALADADMSELGERADRLADPFADRLDARDEGCGDRAHTRKQNAQLPGSGFDVDAFLECHRETPGEKEGKLHHVPSTSKRQCTDGDGKSAW
jgi:hypothetical protein